MSSQRKPIRVAHLLPWPAVGGTEIGTLRVAEATHGDEFESIAFCVEGSEPVARLFEEAHIPVVTFRPAQVSIRHGARFYTDSQRIAKLLRRERISILHCADLLAAEQAAFAGRLAGVTVLCHIRNRFEEIPWRSQLQLRSVDRFAFVSRDTWKRFGYAVAPKRATVIYDGLDLPTFDADRSREAIRSEFGIAPDVPVIGMSARVAPQKDHFTLVESASAIVAAHPRVRFLMVGDHASSEALREHYGKVRERIEKRGLEKYFIFTGHRAEGVQMIAAMDLFVLSTHHEGLPLVLLEAMSLGKAVVATDVDGIGELVEDGKNGLLAPHEDPHALALSINRLLANAEERERLGQAGQDRMQKLFTRDHFREQMLALYRSLV